MATIAAVSVLGGGTTALLPSRSTRVFQISRGTTRERIDNGTTRRYARHVDIGASTNSDCQDIYASRGCLPWVCWVVAVGVCEEELIGIFSLFIRLR